MREKLTFVVLFGTFWHDRALRSAGFPHVIRSTAAAANGAAALVTAPPAVAAAAAALQQSIERDRAATASSGAPAASALAPSWLSVYAPPADAGVTEFMVERVALPPAIGCDGAVVLPASPSPAILLVIAGSGTAVLADTAAAAADAAGVALTRGAAFFQPAAAVGQFLKLSPGANGLVMFRARCYEAREEAASS